MRLRREVLLILFVTVVLLVGLYYLRAKGEGFQDTTQLHGQFVERQEKYFNALGSSLVAANMEGNLGNNSKSLLGTTTAIDRPNRSPDIIIDDPYPVSGQPDGMIANIKKCEAVKTADCGKLDDPNFAKDCGICVDVGMGADNTPKTGGLVLREKDREHARKYKRGNRLPDYKPTMGSCPANRFASTKAECLRIKKEMDCQKGANFDLAGCSQCYSDQSYFPVDTATNQLPGTLYYTGVGEVAITEAGQSPVIKILKGEVLEYKFRGGEGTSFTIVAKPETNGGTTPEVAGVFIGTTPRGVFSIDLRRLVKSDGTTGRKPRSLKPSTIKGVPATTMVPGYGFTVMTLNSVIPFSFVDADSAEGDMCVDGPYVTKQASAEFLDSDPCYKKGSGPGNYNLECLQGVFLTNGCLQTGKAFPTDAATSTQFLISPTGQKRTLNEIANMVYSRAIIAATGMDNGVKLDIPKWSEASEFCTGRKITSPCDTETRDTGPLSVDCLQYLWRNEGEGNPLGATYLSSSTASSLFKTKDTSQFCQSTGTLSPIDDKGQINYAAVEFWKRLGGVERVRERMRQIHITANSNVGDDAKATELMQCYGRTLATRPAPKGDPSGGKCKVKCGVTASRVRIEKRGNSCLNFAQCAVWDANGENVALGKRATMKSLWPDGITRAENAIDGVYAAKSHWGPGGEAHVHGRDCEDGWWEVDLQGEFDIVRVTIWNRGDCCQDRIRGARLMLLNASGGVVTQRTVNTTDQFIIFNFRTGSNVAECMKCDTSTDNQAFAIAINGGYNHTKSDGPAVCALVGARQATRDEVVAAQKAGSDVCFTAYTSDYNQGIYPINGTTMPGCGNGSPGMKEWTPGGGWVRIGGENETVTVAPNTRVRYGSGSRWVERTESGRFRADNARYGDPIPGVYKQIDRWQEGAGGIWCFGQKPVAEGEFGDGARFITRNGSRYVILNWEQPGRYSAPPKLPGTSLGTMIA